MFTKITDKKAKVIRNISLWNKRDLDSYSLLAFASHNNLLIKREQKKWFLLSKNTRKHIKKKIKLKTSFAADSIIIKINREIKLAKAKYMFKRRQNWISVGCNHYINGNHRAFWKWINSNFSKTNGQQNNPIFDKFGVLQCSTKGILNAFKDHFKNLAATRME